MRINSNPCDSWSVLPAYLVKGNLVLPNARQKNDSSFATIVGGRETQLSRDARGMTAAEPLRVSRQPLVLATATPRKLLQFRPQLGSPR